MFVRDLTGEITLHYLLRAWPNYETLLQTHMFSSLAVRETYVVDANLASQKQIFIKSNVLQFSHQGNISTSFKCFSWKVFPSSACVAVCLPCNVF